QRPGGRGGYHPSGALQPGDHCLGAVASGEPVPGGDRPGLQHVVGAHDGDVVTGGGPDAGVERAGGVVFAVVVFQPGDLLLVPRVHFGPDLFGGDVVADHDQVHSPGIVVQHGPYGARDRPGGGVHGDHHIDPRVIASGPAPHLVSTGPVLPRVIAPCPVIPGPLNPRTLGGARVIGRVHRSDAGGAGAVAGVHGRVLGTDLFGGELFGHGGRHIVGVQVQGAMFDGGDRLGIGGGSLLFDQLADTVLDVLPLPAGGPDHDRPARHEGFGGRDAEVLGLGGQEEHVGISQRGTHSGAIGCPGQAHQVLHVLLACPFGHGA